MLHFLHNAQQKSCLLTSAIILTIFFQRQNSILLSVEFPRRIIPYGMMEWSKRSERILKFLFSWGMWLLS
jgi:hypothetical protein